MTRTHHARHGIAALVAYAVGLVVVALAGWEVGARQLGYVPLTTRVFGPSGPPEAEVRRWGRMLVKADYLGNCREYTVDNRTQQVIDKGIVPCEPPKETESAKPKTTGGKFDSFRDAFGKK
ncbi:hypothetical protein PQJ75_06410 [Rhodoplanes sp. TEM]|uniref:Uncharacterized protein n=1 Tax=Rhodoplanes tepidamans TaxID=200616 RepID=A0ABT5J7U4_RHOTP|nr:MULTISPECIES: hypothetical protein [Rhodoplanes]MDC7785724.1 hypothetical protein [Rhodoplanes tepidamans]MDC7983358.1 hypothetical protein [Rhodoplanes sp. TEM]MDQ0354714.1 hypothetical protein [Rhodoplanes tepidamans]